MKLNKLCKRVLSVTLAAALAVGTPIAVGPQTVKAEDGVEEVKLPEPIYENDFSKDEGVTITTAEGVTDKAAIKDGELVMPFAYVNESNIVTLNADLSKVEDGFTLMFKVKADEANPASENYGVVVSLEKPVGTSDTKGLLTLKQTLKPHINMTANTGGENVFIDNWSGDLAISTNSFDNIALTLDKTAIKVYKNGSLIGTYTDDSGLLGDPTNKAETLLNWLKSESCKIVLGSVNQAGDLNWHWWDFGGTYDDVKVYGTALTEEQIQSMVPPVKSITVSADKTTLTNTRYYSSEEDKKNDKQSGYKVDTAQFQIKTEPADAFYSSVDWKVDGPATIDENGKLTLKDEVTKDTELTVTATTDNGTTNTCKVTAKLNQVVVKDVTDITIADQVLYLGTNEKDEVLSGNPVTISPKITPDDATVKDVKLETDAAGEKVVSIDGYTITPISEGTATITATSVSNKELSKTFKVDVKPYEFGKGTISSFTAVGYDVETRGSGFEKVTGNFDVEYTFDETSNGPDVWDNFIVEVKNSEGKSNIYRADPFALAQDFGTVSWAGTLGSNFASDMKKGAKVTVRIAREGDKLTVSYYVNASSGTEYYLSAVSTFATTEESTMGKDLYIRIFGEDCTCKNISLDVADQSVELGIGGSKEYKVSDILPVETVDKIETVPPATETASATGTAVEAKSDIVDIKTGTDSITVTGLKVGTETVQVTDPVSKLSFAIKVNVSDDSAAPAPTTSPAPSQDPGTASGPAVTPGEPTQAPTTSDTPGSSDTPGTTPSEPTATPGDNDDNTGDDEKNEPQATTATVNKGGAKTTVKTTENGTAAIKKVKSSKKSVTVSSTVKVEGVEYKVTVIEANAFANCKKATKITLPSTVKTIKKKAFTGAKKVKTIVVKSKKAVTVKKGAFKGINTKKITIKASKMSKKQLKKFKKTLKKAGFKGKVKK